MIPRLFLDTNVLLDVLLERPGYEAVLDILQLGSDGKVALCTSYLSMADIAYVLRKEYIQWLFFLQNANLSTSRARCSRRSPGRHTGRGFR